MKSKIRNLTITASLCVAVLLMAQGIFAQQSTSAAMRPEGRLYATAAAGAKLLTVNLESKTVTVIGNTGFPFSLALALCPGGGAYTITNTFDPNKAQLATLNLRTGAARLVGSPLGQALSTMGMTCSRDGTLYAIGQANSMDPDYNSLYTVDRETGLARRIGPTSVSAGMGGFLMALAFAPDGTLYGANVKALFRIDRFSGYAMKVVDFMGVTSVMGLAIDEDGNFCIADFVAQSSIYMLNVATGMATPILNTGLPFVHNIAFKKEDD